MYVLLDSLNVVSELIPDIAPEFPSVPIEQRYTPEFVARLIHVDDSVEVHQNWMHNPEDGTFYEPTERPEPEPEPEPEPTQLDRVEAQVTYTAMLTDTLLPGGV